MEAGIADHPWSIEEVIALLDVKAKTNFIAREEGRNGFQFYHWLQLYRNRDCNLRPSRVGRVRHQQQLRARRLSGSLQEINLTNDWIHVREAGDMEARLYAHFRGESDQSARILRQSPKR
jgi:hypothetical protein